MKVKQDQLNKIKIKIRLKPEKYRFLYQKEHRLHTNDLMYLDFIRWCLEIDPN